MIDESLQALVGTVTRALTAAGYASEPDPANNTSNAPAYIKVFCKGIPKNKRVDYLNLVFSGTNGEYVTIEGEDTIRREIAGARPIRMRQGRHLVGAVPQSSA